MHNGILTPIKFWRSVPSWSQEKWWIIKDLTEAKWHCTNNMEIKSLNNQQQILHESNFKRKIYIFRNKKTNETFDKLASQVHYTLFVKRWDVLL